MSSEDERHYWWWPDEWEAIADNSAPCPTDSLVQEWDSVFAEVPEERFGEFVARTVEVLTGALHSAAASLIALNRDHPDRQLYADALA